jgi:hypothetical protein
VLHGTTSSSATFGVEFGGSTTTFAFTVGGAAVSWAVSPTALTWQHHAFVRSGTTLTWYINGASQGGRTFTNNVTATGAMRLGALNTGTSAINGFISNLRIIKGTAVYTGAFSPPIAPLSTSGSASASAYSSTTNVNITFSSSECSLLCNFTNAAIIDATADNVLETVGNAQISTTQSRFGGSSISFDGSGDYLYQPNQVNLQFGTGDYTVEFWIYPNSFSGTPVIIDFRTVNAASGGAIQIYMTTGGVLTIVGGSSTGTTLITAAAAISTGAWTHVALTRSGTSTRLFINGTQSSSTATDSTSYGLGALWIGAIASGSTNYFNGYLDDLRVTKGFARYTANFVPPTSALQLQ